MKKSSTDEVKMQSDPRKPAELIASEAEKRRSFVGNMIGTAEIVGDIISPVIDLQDIEAYRDEATLYPADGSES
jgi:hypothetical protein